MNLLFAMVILLLLFGSRATATMARRGLFGALGMNVVLMYAVHCVYKAYLRWWYNKKRNVTHVYLVTTTDRAEGIIKQLKNSDEKFTRRIRGIAIIDNDLKGKEIAGVPVVAAYEDALEYAKVNIVDEVYINVSYVTGNSLRNFIMEFERMGITVYLNINILEKFEGFDKQVTMYGSFPVISFCAKTFEENKMLVKRAIDIAGAIVGLLITAVITVFVAPAILIESPGPLFFKQKRVGKNGRYFYMYKFRSMYKDAEERKKALMEQNEMKGLMFKMTDDPRITKVGKFIRATSIDELPQFFNVLKGDMSLVGTRPPTVDEFMQYAGYHKRRLSIKPGITGLWQVSGRSNIEDFEEVVKLDLEYIDNWSIALDIKILLKTVLVVFKKDGSR
jgi:exopolysaccharide biosynthesis polyprenyl glycosylphosphotransferase